MTSHFTGPLLNSDKQRGARQWFSKLPIGNEPDYVVLFEDFVTGVFNSNADAREVWVVVKDSGASVNDADARNGIVTLTSAATTENDGASIQTQNEWFTLTAGKRLWFEGRFFITDAEGDAMDVFVGMCENFATNPEACLTASNRIGFQVADGDSNILLKAEDGDSESSADSGSDIVSGTYVTAGFYWDGAATLDFFLDRAWVASFNTTDHNIPLDEELAMAAMSLSGSATGTKSMTVDYMYAAMER